MDFALRRKADRLLRGCLGATRAQAIMVYQFRQVLFVPSISSDSPERGSECPGEGEAFRELHAAREGRAADLPELEGIARVARSCLSPRNTSGIAAAHVLPASILQHRISARGATQSSKSPIYARRAFLLFSGSASLFVLVGLIGRLADKRVCEKTWIGLPGQARRFLRSSGTAIVG